MSEKPQTTVDDAIYQAKHALKLKKARVHAKK
jgi:hypothetical protein